MPGIFNATIAALLLAIIVPLALLASQQPPPAIAEFAPQDQQQIKKAPSAQVGDLGEGDLNGQTPPSPSPQASGIVSQLLPSPPLIDVARVRRCVGSPPRQTEDPQSPPCVPYFQGNNGGSTYPHGVSGSTITVAYDFPAHTHQMEDFASYFNRRFEFYGRQLKMVSAPSTLGFGGASSPQAQIDFAAADDQERHAFASLSYAAGRGGANSAFLDAMARRGLVTMEGQANLNTEANMSRNQPFQWSTIPPDDKAQRYLGDFLCTTLARRSPRLSVPQRSLKYPNGPPERRWALINAIPMNGLPAPDVSILRSAMNGCGAQPLVDVTMPDNSAGSADNVMAQLATNDVTTVLCFCADYIEADLMTEADKQARTPEWVISTHFFQDDDRPGSNTYPQDQARHAFGLSWFNKNNPAEQTFWYPAIHEVDPSITLGPGVSNGSDYLWLAWEYRDLLTLASGIQMAGPNLTPQSMQSALSHTHFPNPGAGAPPYYQASIGFGPGNHAAYQDVSLVWWNPTGQSLTNAPAAGTFCYADLGTRYSIGNFPPDDRLFQTGACR